MLCVLAGSCQEMEAISVFDNEATSYRQDGVCQISGVTTQLRKLKGSARDSK